jgi:hypothetical protein
MWDCRATVNLNFPFRFRQLTPPRKQLAEKFDVIFGDTVPLTKRLVESYAARSELLRKHGKPKGLPLVSAIMKADEAEDGRSPCRAQDRADHKQRN